MNGPHDPRILPNGRYRLNLNEPDERCLLPAHWGGEYPPWATAKQRFMRISEQQGHRCCYCGKRTWSPHYGEKGPYRDRGTVEHIIPRKHGGTNRRTNLAMACSECNNERDTSNAVVFMYESMGLLDFELVPKEGENK